MSSRLLCESKIICVVINFDKAYDNVTCDLIERLKTLGYGTVIIRAIKKDECFH